MSRVSGIPAALFVAAIPLFLVTASVTWAFNNPGLYSRGFDKYAVSRVTGINEGDLLQVAADIRHYFNSRDEPLAVRTRILGTERDLFNGREVLHMRDVKRLVWGVYAAGALSALYLLAGAGLSLVRRRRRSAEVFARRCLWGGGLTVALILAVGLFALAGFDTLFLTFHRLSFANDLWRLDQRTDYLVMLFPQGFWYDATMWVATRALAGALLLAAISGGYLLYRRRTAQKEAQGPLDKLGDAPEA